MKRETFVTLLSTLLSEADDELLREAEGLCFWRRRELRAERVQQYAPGHIVEYTLPSGARRVGIVHHLNKYSLTIREPHETEGYKGTVVAIERVLGVTNAAINIEPQLGAAVGALHHTTEGEAHAGAE